MPTTTTNPGHPDVPLPAGAVFGGVWEDVKTAPWRTVTFTSRQIIDHDGRITLGAVQYADGSVDEFSILPSGLDYYLNSDQARELASVLLEAAAEMDGWVTR